MTIESTCPSCNSRLKAPPGVKVACPKCKAVFKMPEAPPDPPAEVVDAIAAPEHMPPPAPPADFVDAIAAPEHLPPPAPPAPEEEAQSPEPKRRRRRLHADEIECPECGKINHEDDSRCRGCGFFLGRRRSRGGDSGIEALIPYRNAWALWAYYLGVFSAIPCLGIPLGIAALVLGIKGISYANAYPEAKGQVHAWVGIIVGGFFALLYTAAIVFVVAAGVSNRR